eukprot:GFYU01010205.1.p1 GENE.GFYU01010205.1~~GFYU01010205.1.p1  ORF type:complete len:598 (+),score=142.75 GFYU01010205.1:196-1989(+)
MSKMKGVVLAGGMGTRLRPLTAVTNKHLLPIYDKPMVYYPLTCLVNAGITEIVLVTGEEYHDLFHVLLGDGSSLGIEKLHYTTQKGSGGIADALKLAEPFVQNNPICVILGDNIIQGNIRQAVTSFKQQEKGAMVLLKHVPDPHRFGVPRFENDKELVEIIEKPSQPPTNYAVIGIYFYDEQVWDFCKQTRPSARGELEITDVNNFYIHQRTMSYSMLSGWWTDAGTFESMRLSTELVREGGANRMDMEATAEGDVVAAGNRHAISPDMEHTVLITGGCGFIGSNFVRFVLEQRPKWKIINFDALTYAGNPESLRDVENDPRYEFVKGDVREKAQLRPVIERCDVVIHMAAESHVDRSIDDANPFITTNIIGTQNLLDLSRSNPHIRRVMVVSSDEVYGDLPLDRPDMLFSELSPLCPSSPYAAAKAAGDMLALSAHRTYNLPIIITRCSNNFGPYQYPEKVIPLFATNLIEGKKVPLYGDGLNVRDWIHVVDHCEGVLLALEKGGIGEVYNIGARNECNNKELTHHILSALGADESSIEYVTDRLGHDRRYAIDATKMETRLGFKAKRSQFPESLLTVVEWYKQNEGWWKPLKEKR